MYLLTDPVVLGALTWGGFAITLFGLTIALRQIAGIKSATKAAAAAVTSLSATIHSRERLLDVSSALRHLDSARHHIVQRDYGKAGIFLEFARSECVQVQELSMPTLGYKNAINTAVVRIARLLEAITLDEAAQQQNETAVKRGLEARAISDGLSAALAQMRYRYSDNGSKHDDTT